MLKEFVEKWNSISAGNEGYLSLDIDHPLDLEFGYSSNGTKSFVVMNALKLPAIPSTYAVKVINEELYDGCWILKFELIHDEYEEEFLHLCWDLAIASQKVTAPLEELISRYLTWQKLLGKRDKSILSFSAQKGLLGELLYLKDLIAKNGEAYGVTAWLGPDGSDQDFVFSDSWSEVKTVALAGTSVKISSLEQLDIEQTGSLVVYILEKTNKTDVCVDLVSTVCEIRSMLVSTIIKEQFNMKLFKYGFRDSDVDSYSKNAFRLCERKDYAVDAEFPRLTKQSVPNGIETANYSISLASIECFRRV